MAEFDAVLAEMDALAAKIAGAGINGFGNHVSDLRTRLQSAHEAEVAERDRMVGEQHAIAERATAEALRQQQERLAATVRADRAVGMLRECRPLVDTCPDLTRPGGDELGERVDAFLSEQAGERENGDG